MGDIDILYRCNGKNICKDSIGCILNGGPCRHTPNPSLALNGRCEDPWNHPERFEKKETLTSEQWWEK